MIEQIVNGTSRGFALKLSHDEALNLFRQLGDILESQPETASS